MNMQSSRSSEAEQYFKRAIRLAPLDSSVHHHYGNFLQRFNFLPLTLSYKTRRRVEVERESEIS